MVTAKSYYIVNVIPVNDIYNTLLDITGAPFALQHNPVDVIFVVSQRLDRNVLLSQKSLLPRYNV